MVGICINLIPTNFVLSKNIFPNMLVYAGELFYLCGKIS
jgi:hypothetical protein